MPPGQRVRHRWLRPGLVQGARLAEGRGGTQALDARQGAWIDDRQRIQCHRHYTIGCFRANL